MSEAMTIKRAWLPLPVLAVPVRVVLDAGSDLDALEETVLHLLRLAPRDEHSLSAKLHVGTDLILSVLNHLVDRILVAPPDEKSQLYRAASDVHLVLAAHSQPAWTFLSPHSNAFLPIVVLGERPLHDNRMIPTGDVLAITTTRPKPALPAQSELEKRLRVLIARGQLAVCRGRAMEQRWHDEAAATVETETAPQPFLVAAVPPRVRSLVLDVAGRERRCTTRTAWVAVDLLPRLRGAAVRVFHEPTMNPFAEETPISPALTSWLEQQDPGAWLAISERASRVSLDLSLVLQRARIGSDEELDRQAGDRTRELLVQHGLRDVEPPPGGPPLAERIRDAERWLILAQKEPTYRPQARDAWSHAIEQLMRSLVEPARPHLQRWKANRRSRSIPLDTAVAKSRLDALRLLGRLGASERHLIRWACDPELHSRLDVDAAGAGASLTFWLLPLLLLDEERAEQYGRHILIAVEHEANLFDNLDGLVAIRNATFHEGRTQRSIGTEGNLVEHTERQLLGMWAALHLGFQNAPPPT